MIVPTCTYIEGEIYIGSTCLPLSARMANHRKKSNTCSSKYLFQKYGVDNCKIVLIENFPCNISKRVLKKKLSILGLKNVSINKFQEELNQNGTPIIL